MGRPPRFLLIALALTAACSGSADKTPQQDIGSSRSGDDDSGVSNETDAAVATPTDAGPTYRACNETAERFRAKSDALPGTSFSLLSDSLNVHLAYLTPTCLGVDGNGTAHGLRYVKLMSAGEVTVPVDIAYADGETCVRVEHPALTVTDGKVALAYAISSAAGSNVFGRAISGGAESKVSGTRTAASITAVDADSVGGTNWSAWSEDNAAGTSTIWLAGTRGSPAEQTLISSDGGYHVTALALRAFPKASGSNVRAAVAFASDSASQPGVFLVALDADLKAVDDVVRLSAATPGPVSIDLQTRGVLYTGGSASAPDLRFRALNERAEPEGDELRVTDANERAAAGSLSPYTVGYAIAYRSVQSDHPDRAWLRLTLIDPQGNLAGYRNLFETSAEGGQVLIRTAVDGRLSIAFREVGSDGTSELQLARITCGS